MYINTEHSCLLAQSCLTLWNPMDCSPPGSSAHGDSPGQNTGAGSPFLLQGIFPTQGLNPGLPNFRRILYHLSHQGSPRTLEWVANPFSRVSSWPRNQTGGLLHCRWILYQLSYQGSNKFIKINSVLLTSEVPTKGKKFTNQHVKKASQHILWQLLRCSVWWQQRTKQIKMYESEWGRKSIASY